MFQKAVVKSLQIRYSFERFLVRTKLTYGGLVKRIMELSFPRTFAPVNESYIDGTFAPENIRSQEQK